MQKEAYMLRTPCITIRDETEWLETVEDGWNVLVGADKERIRDAADHFEPKRATGNVFGDGDASRNIVKRILCEESSG
jgi:UDP-N-acetylglucosamine 2-epimerase